MKGSGTFIEDGLKEMILFLLCSPVESRMTGRDGSLVGPVARGRERTQGFLLPWPQVTSCTSCSSEEEWKLPQVSSGPHGLSLKASLRKNLENIHEHLDGLASPGLAPWVWSGETPAHSAAQTPNPGPWSTEKTSVKYQLFISFVVQCHSNIFTQKKLLNRNRKQKYPINLTEFLLRCGQSS